MATSTVSVEREIHADPAAVWRVVTGLDRATEVFSAITAVERLEGEGYDVGVRWRETRKVFGKEETEEMWVSAIEPMRSTTVEARSGGAHYTTRFFLDSSDLGTQLRLEFSVKPLEKGMAKLAWKVFGSFGMKATQKALVQDLADIAAAVESRD
ncbi:SRPBCC family protein [Demequina sp.]|uniref:SRPBCC family protein n=1 Tax=Demequina sp. TaxID=2050685 RepID=UPI003A836F37